MGLLKQHYGRLGTLSRDEWKKLLSSNHGLFQRARRSPPNTIVGPKVTSPDSPSPISGGMLFNETMFFYDFARKEQKNFYLELTKTNPAAAAEYLLTLTNSLNIWKEDLRWLRVILHYLERRESVLRLEERILRDAGKKISEVGFPEILKRHFPDLFQDLEMEDTNFEQLIHKLQETEVKMKQLEGRIREYLLELEVQKPFLFE